MKSVCLLLRRRHLPSTTVRWRNREHRADVLRFSKVNCFKGTQRNREIEYNERNSIWRVKVNNKFWSAIRKKFSLNFTPQKNFRNELTEFRKLTITTLNVNDKPRKVEAKFLFKWVKTFLHFKRTNGKLCQLILFFLFDELLFLCDATGVGKVGSALAAKKIYDSISHCDSSEEFLKQFRVAVKNSHFTLTQSSARISFWLKDRGTKN